MGYVDQDTVPPSRSSDILGDTDKDTNKWNDMFVVL